MSTQERPADGIRINVPDESSMVTVASGEAFVVEIEDGRRVVYLRHDDARRLLLPVARGQRDLSRDARPSAEADGRHPRQRPSRRA